MTSRVKPHIIYSFEIPISTNSFSFKLNLLRMEKQMIEWRRGNLRIYDSYLVLVTIYFSDTVSSKIIKKIIEKEK